LGSNQTSWAVLAEGIGSARVEAHRLRHLMSRALGLVGQSKAKDHIYQMAGDIILAAPQRLEALELDLDRVSYMLSRLGEDYLRERLPLSDRKMIDEAMHKAQPMKPERRKMVERVASRYLNKGVGLDRPRPFQGDLNPSLGWPGGICHLIDRIELEVSNPKLRQELIDDVERGHKLDNADANTIYDLESEPGAGNFKKMEITPHAQYRMDQRNVIVHDLRFALKAVSEAYNRGQELASQNVRKQKLQVLVNQAQRWNFARRRREPIMYTDPHKLTVVFVWMGDTARIVTTYWEGKSDPRPQREESCPA